MRLGTSSPNTIVTNVIAVTTMAVALISAAPCGTPYSINQAAKPALNAASPRIPFNMPIEVMPTCTEERNWVGSLSKFSAARAPGSPLSASAMSRILRLEASANSDMANTPLSSVNSAISRKFMNQQTGPD